MQTVGLGIAAPHDFLRYTHEDYLVCVNSRRARKSTRPKAATDAKISIGGWSSSNGILDHTLEPVLVIEGHATCSCAGPETHCRVVVVMVAVTVTCWTEVTTL